jgi:hypothetical protein
MRAHIGLEDVHTGHSRSRPTADRSLLESSTTAQSNSQSPRKSLALRTSAGRKRRAQHLQNPVTARGHGKELREPTASYTHCVTVQKAARILETGADALLEAKYEVIADLRDGGGSIKEQHHCKCRSQEADVR